MTKTTGGSVSGGWNIWSNGSVSANHDFASGANTVRVVARGDQYQGAPTMVVSVGAQTISTTNVTATNWTTYTFSYNAATSGVREIKISFTNDKRGTDGDRNLLVDKVSVACSGTGGSGGTGGLGDPTRVELLHASFTKAALGAYSQAEVAADFVGAPTWNNGLNEGCATIVDEAGSRFLRVTYAGGQFGPAPGGVQFKVPL